MGSDRPNGKICGFSDGKKTGILVYRTTINLRKQIGCAFFKKRQKKGVILSERQRVEGSSHRVAAWQFHNAKIPRLHFVSLGMTLNLMVGIKTRRKRRKCAPACRAHPASRDGTRIAEFPGRFAPKTGPFPAQNGLRSGSRP